MTSDLADNNGNGKALLIGQLSGELGALVKSCQSCRDQQAHLHEQTQNQLLAIRSDIGQIAAGLSNHVTFHRATELSAARAERSALRSETAAQSSEDRETAGKRWSWTTTLQVITTCTAVAAIILALSGVGR